MQKCVKNPNNIIFNTIVLASSRGDGGHVRGYEPCQLYFRRMTMMDTIMGLYNADHRRDTTAGRYETRTPLTTREISSLGAIAHGPNGGTRRPKKA